ncbi:hypothetical protein Q9L58_009174 [Maublancomyces gigas]|uniref:Uncharacterized protein n=1 Tax=Discina gigas TaxID=1032678 RepID=A0ABR3G8C3_9PEZI
MASQHRLKVGIDFGTTYSGVSWAHTGNPKEVFLIREWPGVNRTSDKVPSEISYTSTGEVHKWGFEIKPSVARLKWFKLLLDPTKYASNTSSTIARTKALIPSSKRPVNVVADYLSCLKKHTTKALERAYGKAFVDVTPVDYCLTVPAIWNDAAKALTLQAAESAGFGMRHTIRLISEPEAAAAWSLMKDIQPNNLKVNDTFVVVDCGGGTVDLISYKVVAVDPSLDVEECAVGAGALCGSTKLNERFEDLVKSRIGQK